MTAPTPNIFASDYNSIRKKIVAVLGNGGVNPETNQLDPTFGYGQSLVSSDITTGQLITKNQWDNLRFDLLNARLHQDTVSLQSIPTVIAGQIIASTGSDNKFRINTEYDNRANTAITNRFNLGPGQFVIDSGITVTRTTLWKNLVTATVTVSFASADFARWFFNSGSKLKVLSSREGGEVKAQNTAWTNLLGSIGMLEFGAVTLPVGFYSLTNTNQTIIQQSSSSPYAANNYKLEVRTNVANNNPQSPSYTGGATDIIFTATWTDGYVDPPLGIPPASSAPVPPEDGVDGTLSLIVQEQRASGVLLPENAGAFIIVRPSYSSTAITGT